MKKKNSLISLSQKIDNFQGNILDGAQATHDALQGIGNNKQSSKGTNIDFGDNNDGNIEVNIDFGDNNDENIGGFLPDPNQ